MKAYKHDILDHNWVIPVTETATTFKVQYVCTKIWAIEQQKIHVKK